MKPTPPLHGLALAFLFSAAALFAAEPQFTDGFTSENDEIVHRPNLRKADCARALTASVEPCQHRRMFPPLS